MLPVLSPLRRVRRYYRKAVIFEEKRKKPVIPNKTMSFRIYFGIYKKMLKRSEHERVRVQHDACH